MNKKGSHVGVIMSFVIFITFAVFMYAILQPSINQKESQEYAIEYLEQELVDMASDNLMSASVSITDNPSPLCVEFVGLITETGIDSKAVVKNELEESLSFYNSGGNLEVTRNNNGHVFFKIYQSEEFKDANGATTPSCSPLILDSGYSIGQVKIKEYVFETKIIELIEDYEGIKEFLENEVNKEVGFGFIYDNNTEISTPVENVSTSIYVEKVPVQYIDSQANIKSGFISIRTWG